MSTILSNTKIKTAPRHTCSALSGKRFEMKYLLEYKFILPIALLLGFAPFVPQPHIVEKIGMLMTGTLKRPIDVFDLVWHGWPFVLLTYRIILDLRKK